MKNEIQSWIQANTDAGHVDPPSTAKTTAQVATAFGISNEAAYEFLLAAEAERRLERSVDSGDFRLIKWIEIA